MSPISSRNSVPLSASAMRPVLPSYSNVGLVLGVSDRNIDLVTEGVDCVIRIGALKDSSLVARRIGAAVMITCAAARYIEEHGEPISLADLQSHRSVNFMSGASRRPLPWAFQEGEKAVTLVPRGAMLVNDSHAYVESGLAGFGLIQVPGILVDRFLASGQLREVLAANRPVPRPISILYPSRQFLAPQVRVFIDWMQQRFATFHETWSLEMPAKTELASIKPVVTASPDAQRRFRTLSNAIRVAD
ncbi:LysR substrate-binding domain-containing protein [Labrys okinawensis]|uniref:LysR substrate-binding domain-containing protein n=1 Tax=Labrys okinawensis TaxID=346911 RepID=UPI0039BD1D73